MDASRHKREPRDYIVPIRTRQQQAKVFRACKDLRYLITIDFPFKGSPKNCRELNKAVRDLSKALGGAGIHGIGFIEFNDPKQIHGRNIPHLHIATPSPFSVDGGRVVPNCDLYKALLSALSEALPWFDSVYLHRPNILDIEQITNLHGLGGYLAKLDFELEGHMRFSSKGRKQKKIPVKYFPMRRLMRFFGNFKNPLKNQMSGESLFGDRTSADD